MVITARKTMSSSVSRTNTFTLNSVAFDKSILLSGDAVAIRSVFAFFK